MTDEPQLRKDLARAARADSLLKDDIIAEAFKSLQADYHAAWLATGAKDTDARERLWQATQLVGKVKAHLENVVRNGTLAKAELDAIAGRKKTLGMF